MWPYPIVIAHRGGGILAPENTLAGIRGGLSRGFHAIEFDVMLSSDGVPILMHDDMLGRTVAGSGAISALSAVQLLQMDAGAWFGAQYAGERIPRFADVIEFCRKNQIWMNIEIKPAPGFEVETGRVAAEMVMDMYKSELAAKAQPAALPLFSSFSFEALQMAQRHAPTIPRGFLMDRISPDWQAKLVDLGAVALHTNHKHLTAELAHDIKAAGYGLMCYTVNDVARAREIMGWGVDAFCTDRIDLFEPQFSPL
jgi:glycerophosphoryl diester phosphodiesterase